MLLKLCSCFQEQSIVFIQKAKSMSADFSVFKFEKCISAPKQICKISCHKFAPDDATVMHSHNFAELFWGVEGRGVHKLNGKEKNISTGTLYLLRPNDVHSVCAAKDTPYAFNNLMFPWKLVEDMRSRYNSPVLEAWCTDDSANALELPLTIVLQTQINMALSDIFMHLDERLPVEYFLLHIIYELERQQNIATPDAPAWLLQVCREIEKPQNFRCGPQIFVKLSGYSYEHISRKAREYIGKTLTEILNDARLNYAASQLVSSARDINEISLFCGFESLSYFYALFRKKFGMSPRIYRIKNRFY